MALRFNPPPGWPPPPAGWMPPPGWAPDPAWPPAPAGWPFVLEDPSAPVPPPPDARTSSLPVSPSYGRAVPGYSPVGPVAPRKRPGALPVVLACAGIFVVVLLALAGIAGVSTSDQASTTTAGESTGSSTTKTTKSRSKDTSRKAKDSAGRKGKDADRPGLGDKARDGMFEFKVTKTSKKSSVGDDLIGEKAQGVFLLVHVKVKNIGNSARTFDALSQSLFDAQGREFSADAAAGIYLEDSNAFLNEINPGNSVKGVVVFDVPKDARPTEIELHDSPFSGGVTVRLSSRRHAPPRGVT